MACPASGSDLFTAKQKATCSKEAGLKTPAELQSLANYWTWVTAFEEAAVEESPKAE